jgi:hypothetical protein
MDHVTGKAKKGECRMELIKSLFNRYPITSRIVTLILLVYLLIESIEAGYKTGISLFG